MSEWIVTSSVLIIIVIGLRFALKGRIGLHLQYGLWLLVLLRLLIPFSIPSSFSIMNIVPEVGATQQPIQSVQTVPTDMPTAEALPQLQQPAAEIEAQPESVESKAPVSTETVLMAVWITGMCVTALVLLGSNLHFFSRLRRTRSSVPLMGCPLPVYRTALAATPCLFGLFRPAVYLTPEVADDHTRSHVLTHELAHYRQLDHVWSFLRCVCLVLHWYNPLVWVAAVLSKGDAELACDEATIRTLGEDQRLDYGHTLIGMTCVKRELNSLFLTATTMAGSKRALKERIRLIAKQPKTALHTLILLCLTLSIAAGCTLTGASTSIPEDAAPENMVTLSPFSKTPLSYNSEPYYLDDGIQACFVNIEGTVYIWDCLYNDEVTEDVLTGHITYLGDVKHNDPYTMPTESFSACRLAVGTKLYQGSDIYGNYRSDILYCQPCPGSDDSESFGRFIPEAHVHGDDRWWEKEYSHAIALTVDELKALVEEKGTLLYTSDFENYTQVRFGDSVDYRILPVEGDYRLLLMFHRNPEVEVMHAKFYHIDSPENYINPLTESIDDFISAS